MAIITGDAETLFTACSLCLTPLDGERYFHADCAKREAERTGNADTDPDRDGDYAVSDRLRLD